MAAVCWVLKILFVNLQIGTSMAPGLGVAASGVWNHARASGNEVLATMALLYTEYSYLYKRLRRNFTDKIAGGLCTVEVETAIGCLTHAHETALAVGDYRSIAARAQVATQTGDTTIVLLLAAKQAAKHSVTHAFYIV